MYHGAAPAPSGGAARGWDMLPRPVTTPPPSCDPRSVLDGVPAEQPSLARAVALSRRAGSEGFDWRNAREVLPVVRGELEELASAMDGEDAESVAGELGDLLFALANLGRHLGIDPEAALHGTCERFTARFLLVEDSVRASGRSMREHSIAELDAWWDLAKRALRAGR